MYRNIRPNEDTSSAARHFEPAGPRFQELERADVCTPAHVSETRPISRSSQVDCARQLNHSRLSPSTSVTMVLRAGGAFLLRVVVVAVASILACFAVILEDHGDADDDSELGSDSDSDEAEAVSPDRKVRPGSLVDSKRCRGT